MAAHSYSLVAEYVRSMIEQASDRQDFRDLLCRLMGQPGRILCPNGPIKWPAFVLCPCEALGGDPEAAVAAAAAVEFIITSADVADDLVDDEWDRRDDQWGRALNASLGLMWLGHRCVTNLADRLGAERACRIGQLISSKAVRACDGEDLDLVLESAPVVTAEETHVMTRLKSGSLVSMACEVGAATATDDPDVLSMVGELGGHIGVVAQLVNDVGGVISGSDLRRRKKTLPIAYALRCAREEGIPDILTWYEGTTVLSGADERRLSEVIRELGALHYASVVADAHRREALSLVSRLARATGRGQVGKLRWLVPKVWAAEMRRGV